MRTSTRDAPGLLPDALSSSLATSLNNPRAVPPPPSSEREIGRYLRLSVAVAVATLALTAGAWWFTGSGSRRSDAREVFGNLAGASFALLMVGLARQPPDLEHPYGHHKAEYFSGGFEGLLILLAALAIVWAAVQRLIDPRPIQALGLGLGLTVLGSLLNAGLAWAMLRKAREHRSVALEADARHLFTDVWTSAGVLLGLVAVRLSGWLWLDPVIAIAVALHIASEGVGLVRRAADGLMDHSATTEVRSVIDRTLARFADPALRFDHVMTRDAGQRLFLNLHLHLPADWTLGQADGLRRSVEQALMNALPELRATIELLPLDVEPLAHDGQDGPDQATGRQTTATRR